MKKQIAFVLVLSVMLILCGCSSSTQNTSTTKYAYELEFPTHSLYYLIDTETCDVKSFIYEMDAVFGYATGQYSGDIQNDVATVTLTAEDDSSWIEALSFGNNGKILFVSMEGSPVVEYKQVSVSEVEKILAKDGYT